MSMRWHTQTIVSRIRAVDSGAWDMGMADFTTAELDAALSWCIRHGETSLAVVIEDELKFRDGGGE